jgi:hypothetical protein
MTGQNAIDCYDLEANALATVAQRIRPGVSELQAQADLSLVPDHYHGSGFRTRGAMS